MTCSRPRATTTQRYLPDVHSPPSPLSSSSKNESSEAALVAALQPSPAADPPVPVSRRAARLVLSDAHPTLKLSTTRRSPSSFATSTPLPSLIPSLPCTCRATLVLSHLPVPRQASRAEPTIACLELACGPNRLAAHPPNSLPSTEVRAKPSLPLLTLPADRSPSVCVLSWPPYPKRDLWLTASRPSLAPAGRSPAPSPHHDVSSARLSHLAAASLPSLSQPDVDRRRPGLLAARPTLGSARTTSVDQATRRELVVVVGLARAGSRRRRCRGRSQLDRRQPTRRAVVPRHPRLDARCPAPVRGEPARPDPAHHAPPGRGPARAPHSQRLDLCASGLPAWPLPSRALASYPPPSSGRLTTAPRPDLRGGGVGHQALD